VGRTLSHTLDLLGTQRNRRRVWFIVLSAIGPNSSAETLHAAQGHPTLLSLATFEELTNPMPKQDYAGGWIVTQRAWADGLALTHAGSNTTWYCVVWLAPNKDFAVPIATNNGSGSVAHDTDKGIAPLIEKTVTLLKTEPLPEALGDPQKAVKAEETGAARIQLDSLKSMDLRRKTALAKSWDTLGWVYTGPHPRE